MAQLGEKYYDYDFYGYETRDYKRNEDDAPFAKLVEHDTYWYYGASGGNYGKPLNNTIGLWKIDRNCSFNYMTVVIPKGIGLYLYTEDCSRIDDVKLAMQITQDDGFTADPIDRLADDFSSYIGAGMSALACDINYSACCIGSQIYVYVPLQSNASNITSFSSLVSYINADNNRKVCRIVPILSAGITLPRTQVDQWIPEPAGITAKRGYITVGTLDYRPIPAEATYWSNEIATRYKPEEETWRGDRVYSPFNYCYNQNWQPVYSYNLQDTLTNQLNIGYYNQLVVSSIINGLDGHERGRFIRCSTRVQDFSDVKYQWRFVMIHRETGAELYNGYDLSELPGDNAIKFMTVLDILDQKNYETLGEATLAAVKHELAYIGFYFAESVSESRTRATGSTASASDLSKLYLPVFSAGTTTGEYVTGEDIRDAPNADSSSVGGDEFKPIGDYTDVTPNLSNIAIGSFYKTGRLYTGLDSIEKLFNNIKSIPSRVDDEGEKVKSQDYWFFGADPYDFMIGYYMYPVMLLPDYLLAKGRITSLSDKSWIQLGKWDTSMAISGGPTKGVPFDMVMPMRRIFVQPTYIPRFYNNFLDFEPYTTMSLYLPYYGSLQLPPSLFIGHDIMIIVLSDLMAGRCTYLIYCDNKQYISVSANCRVELPITGEDISAYCENIIRGKQEVANTIVNTARNIANIAGDSGLSYAISNKRRNPLGQKAALAKGIASGVGELVSGGMNVAFQISNMKRLQPTPQTISLGSGTESLGNILEPFIVLNLPEKLDSFSNPIIEANYGKLNGFACYDVNTLSAYHGFTIMENPILDGLDCSAEEKDMIRSLLAEGVILP